MATSIISRDQFVKESYTETVNLQANGYGAINKVVTKSGYVPLCYAGGFATGDASGSAVLVRGLISEETSGSCRLTYGVRNISSGAVSWTLTAYVIWRKVGGVVRKTIKALQTLAFVTERGCV